MADVFRVLNQYDGLTEVLSIEKVMDFIRLGTLLKQDILATQQPNHNPDTSPTELPQDIRLFLSSATELEEKYVDGCWEALRDVIWRYDTNAQTSFALRFEAYGLSKNLSKSWLHPGTSFSDVCLIR